jgi:hypothetical protein
MKGQSAIGRPVERSLTVLLTLRNTSRRSSQPDQAKRRSSAELKITPAKTSLQGELNRFNCEIYVAHIKAHTGTYLHTASRR